MQKDVVAGRELELDAIGGPIVRCGERYGIDVSTTVGARTAGQAAHRHHQSDSCLSIGARGCRRQGLRFLRSELSGILATRSDVLSSRIMHIIENLAGDGRHRRRDAGRKVLNRHFYLGFRRIDSIVFKTQ
jgi:hypothetical protein